MPNAIHAPLRQSELYVVHTLPDEQNEQITEQSLELSIEDDDDDDDGLVSESNPLQIESGFSSCKDEMVVL